MAEAERITDTSDTPAPGAESGPQDGAEGTESPSAERTAEAAAEDAAATPHPAVVGRRRMAVLLLVALGAYLHDLGSKALVVARLENHEPVSVIGDWLRFEAIRNPGAAFSMGEAYTIVFTLIAAAVVVVIARLARKLNSAPWAVALGLLLGGALGNLTDRLFRSPGVFKGAVVDFIAPKGFAVFNLADSAIVCGGILIVLLSFRGIDPDGTVHRD